jgi:ribosomal protein S27AE
VRAVICPRCGEGIDDLEYNTKLEEGGAAFLLGTGGNEIGYQERHTEVYDLEFFCPKCGALLFDNDEDALDFLLGEDGFVTVSEVTSVDELLAAMAAIDDIPAE